MQLTMQKPHSHSSMSWAAPLTFIGYELALSWETWHRCFGHVAYSGLWKLLDKKLVDGFNVDKCTPTPDCVACTEAKQHVKPFPKVSNRNTNPGELTHIDLWGKYAVQSINNNQYYLLMVDNAKRYATVECMKEKLDTGQGVINYLTYLIAQGQTPKAIQIDCGREFVNKKLEMWCKECGIEIHLTAPYSPSQNGVMEQMNQTLVELSHAMLDANDLPEFLWEYAVLHAAYLWNCSYTKHLPNSTPYQGWFDAKPNITHLREFRAPIWILLQGQKEQWKMLSKSKCQVYIGYDDGAWAVKYYNTKTHKILISHNFHHINPPDDPIPPEPIIITPDVPREGETAGSMPPIGVIGSDNTTQSLKSNWKQKWNEGEGNIDINELWKMHGICTNYQHLHDPFPDEEEEETFLTIEEVYAIIAGDKLTNLKEAKDSPDWPEWE